MTTYRGIRYATGDRFAAPQPVAFDPETVSAAAPRGPVAPQLPPRFGVVVGPQAEMDQDEQCQLLSVTTGSRTGSRPVMVWFHGGAYQYGGGELPWFDADHLVAEHDVVVVSVTSRLGALGYLRLDEMTGPSLGMADQVEALSWVRAQIAHFGGDPERVTVFGQSAGAHSIRALIEWGHGGSLFSRAILQSSPAQPLLTEQTARGIAAQILGALGPDPADAPLSELLQAQVAVVGTRSLPMPLAPVAPPAPVPRTPIEVLAGWTAHDGAPFVVGPEGVGGLLSPRRRAMTAVATRLVFVRGARQIQRLSREDGGDARLYRFAWGGGHSPLRSSHCMELPFLLGTDEAWKSSPVLDGHDVCRSDLAVRMRSLWAGFATSGSRSLPGRRALMSLGQT